MKNFIRLAPVALLAAFLAGCQGPCQNISKIDAPALTAGSVDFTQYVAVGTSISAGWQSGGLVNRHQMHSFPAVFAQQVGKTVLASGTGSFSFPAVDGNGIPALLRIEAFKPLLIVGNDGLTAGSPINLTQPTPYNNMGVPGAILYDFDNTLLYNATASRAAIFGLVGRGLGAISLQALALHPTFMTFEYGANEVLGPATAGYGTAAQTPYMSADTFAVKLTAAMNEIHTVYPNLKLALFNVPDVASIPFFTTFPSFTIDTLLGTPVSLIGPVGPLGKTDHITLKAGALLAYGHGFPLGSYNYVNPSAPGLGDALPDSVVFDSGEHDAIEGAITRMNTAIDSVARRPWITKVDLNGLLTDIATNGYMLGSTHYTSAFVTGGLFSLDGVHPTDLAHALITNRLIDAVNARWGATIPHVNPAQFATTSASAALPVGSGSGSRPFGSVQTNFPGLFMHR